jgi:hypothetical protein
LTTFLGVGIINHKEKKMDKLKELQELIKTTNKGGYFRCSICNCVSNESIQTELGDYSPNMSFTHDPKDHRHFICVSCDEAIQEVRQDFEYMDEDDELDT